MYNGINTTYYNLTKGVQMRGKNYTIKEAAVKSGMSESWWRQAVLNKRVLYHKIGKRVLIPEQVIIELFSNPIEPTAQRT